MSGYTIIIICGAAVFVACIIVSVFYLLIFVAEGRNVSECLKKTSDDLLKLEFDELRKLATNEPRKIISYKMTKLMRRLEGREMQSNWANEAQIVITISGTKNPALEQQFVITKKDNTVGETHYEAIQRDQHGKIKNSPGA